MSRSRRLKENSSTPPLLGDEELFVARAMPVSADIHRIAFVLRKDGFFEFAEWITPVRLATNVFYKETGSVADEQLAGIEATAGAVRELSRRLRSGIPFEEIDPLKYESHDRRSIMLWGGTQREECSSWSDSLYRVYRVSDSLIRQYNEQFNCLWCQLFGLPRFFHVVTSGGCPAFPLESVGSSRRNHE